MTKAISLLLLAASAFGACINRTTIIQRADLWISQNVPYDPTRTHNNYRMDCSGYVSYCWEASPAGLSCPDTDTLATSKYSTAIAESELLPGDAIICTKAESPNGEGHAILFAGWLDSKHANYKGCAEHEPGRLTSCETVPYPYYPNDPRVKCFHPHRYVNTC
eukprot:TRINITY_DN81070_c0_g1_i1.p1 TRINITY_DN81070_c0_g1~~TRINITY_DN81070_c0_g1_i1.p1  ORF type:complete len:173 (+),score=18.64 TRINITY_DN81070_c0_g1_i1:31-519(+)